MGKILKWNYWKKKRSILGKRKHMTIGPESTGHACRALSLQCGGSTGDRTGKVHCGTARCQAKELGFSLVDRGPGGFWRCEWHNQTYSGKVKEQNEAESSLLLFITSKNPIHTGLTCRRSEASLVKTKQQGLKVRQGLGNRTSFRNLVCLYTNTDCENKEEGRPLTNRPMEDDY